MAQCQTAFIRKVPKSSNRQMLELKFGWLRCTGCTRYVKGLKSLRKHIFNVIKKHIIKIFNNKYLIKKHIHLRVSISLILIVRNVEFLLLPVVDVIKLFWRKSRFPQN